MNKSIITIRLFLTLFVLLIFTVILIVVVAHFEKSVKEEQFYCGVTDEFLSNDINYQNQKLIQNLKGNLIWENNCTACHSYTKNIVIGPGLYGKSKNLKKSFFYTLLQKDKKMTLVKNSYYKKLCAEYGNLMCHEKGNFNFTDAEVASIIQFIDSTTYYLDSYPIKE